MGILSRWRYLSTPRGQGYGRLWDNVNSGGASMSNPYTTATQGGVTTSTQSSAFVRGPNPNPMVHTVAWKDPLRKFSPYAKTQPQIPVKQPWAVSSTYIQNTGNSTGQYQGQVPATPQPGNYRAMSPSQTMQRDTEWDAADPARLQRGYFITPSQRYFNQQAPLPEFTTPSYHVNSVIAGDNEYFPTESKRGWYQNFDPGITMRENDVAVAPPWLLSTPLNVRVRQYSEYDTHRRPIVAKAPHRHKQASGV